MRPLTTSQRKTFFSLIRSAAVDLGIDQNVYRKRIMMEELGVDSLSQVDRTNGYDRLMARVWQDLGDYERASFYVGNSLIRLKHLIVEAASKIVKSSGGTALDYVAGVMYRAGMIDARPTKAFAESLSADTAWTRFEEHEVRVLLMMLNTHLARQRRA